MRITVLGCGRWGSFLATYHSRKHDVTLWGIEGDPSYDVLAKERKNSFLTLPDNVNLTADLKSAVDGADYIVISISAQALRQFATRLNSETNISGKTLILCMKGIEEQTGTRLSQVVKQCITQPVNVAVWVGPGHVQDFLAGIPNAMVVDSEQPDVTKRIVDELNSDLIRLYIGHDVIGSEIGAAAKNVIGIAAGMLDGVGYASLKGALMARGAREVARLIKAMGGNELSAYGLCHLGDYEATLFSPHSQNRMFGEKFVKGEKYEKLAEGVPTCAALIKMSAACGVEMPITAAVHAMVYEGASVESTLKQLFARSVKGEFES